MAPPLKRFGLPVKLEQMEAGDVAFTGRGPEDRPILVGVEIKRVEEIISDFNRVKGQIAAMDEMYESWWVLIQGGTRAGPLGLQIQRGKVWVTPEGRSVSYSEFAKRRFTIMLRTRGHSDRTQDRAETVAWIASFYSWWQEKWESHESCTGIYHSSEDGLKNHQVSLMRPTNKDYIAARLVGPKTGMAALRHFRSLFAMFAATEREWMEVEGVGKGKAREVVRLVNEEGR